MKMYKKTCAICQKEFTSATYHAKSCPSTECRFAQRSNGQRGTRIGKALLPNRVDLTDQTIGVLKPLFRSSGVGHRITCRWRCRCLLCGEEKDVLLTTLNNPPKRQCRCQQHTWIAEENARRRASAEAYAKRNGLPENLGSSVTRVWQSLVALGVPATATAIQEETGFSACVVGKALWRLNRDSYIFRLPGTKPALHQLSVLSLSILEKLAHEQANHPPVGT